MQDQQKDNSFPFTLADLAFWVIKRKDGTVAKFVIGETKTSNAQETAAHYGTGQGQSLITETSTTKTSHLSEYCHHTPVSPTYVGEDISLYVADSWGIRSMKNDFDFIVDCGDVFKVSDQNNMLVGDQELVGKLSQFSTRARPTRILQIDWDDRRAPDLEPEFWTSLLPLLRGDVCVNCQGGHGRSGTSAVCLMMVMSPDYSALDAITHLRAVHCPRAIESKLQHEYINLVAKYLKRDANAMDAEKVSNFKEAFLASKKKTAIRSRKELATIGAIKL